MTAMQTNTPRHLGHIQTIRHFAFTLSSPFRTVIVPNKTICIKLPQCFAGCGPANSGREETNKQHVLWPLAPACYGGEETAAKWMIQYMYMSTWRKGVLELARQSEDTWFRVKPPVWNGKTTAASLAMLYIQYEPRGLSVWWISHTYSAYTYINVHISNVKLLRHTHRCYKSNRMSRITNIFLFVK